MSRRAPVVLCGAAPDTGNLGVSALCGSVLHGVSKRLPEGRIVVFDNSPSAGALHWRLAGTDVDALRCGAYLTRRFYRPECLWNVRASARLGGLWNTAAQNLSRAMAVLDISGGDSFTDMYGAWRFRAITLPKYMALELGRPLVLLPQTYGPFSTRHARDKAQYILRKSHMAWARDAESLSVLQSLLGSGFDSARHCLGVDVAFSLPAVMPDDAVVATVASLLTAKARPLVGLNVSGLILNRPEEATARYGLKASYRDIVLELARRLLRKSDVRILLVPHVVAPRGCYESDIDACESVLDALGKEAVGRVQVAPIFQDPCEVKWLISQCDWFCGTRMHSTIAALSTGVPTAAISYSPKTLGVFETCAQGARVADPRALDTADMVDHLWQSWEQREAARASLAEALPAVLRQAETQMDEIVAACGLRADPQGTVRG